MRATEVDAQHLEVLRVQKEEQQNQQNHKEQQVLQVEDEGLEKGVDVVEKREAGLEVEESVEAWSRLQSSKSLTTIDAE